MILRCFSRPSLLVTVLAFCQSAWAFETKYYPDTGRILIIADSCVELKGYVEALAQWAERLGDGPVRKQLNCDSHPDLHSMEVQDLLPSGARKIYGRYSGCDGPNCVNSALIGAGILKHPRHTGIREWDDRLDKHCVKRNSSEALQPGDIGEITKRTSDFSGQGFSERVDHGFVFVNSQLVFSKYDTNNTSSAELMSMARMFNSFGVDPSCNNPDPVPDDCGSYVSYYNCSPNLEEPANYLSYFDSNLSVCVMRGTGSFDALYRFFKAVEPLMSESERLSYRYQVSLMEHNPAREPNKPSLVPDIAQPQRLGDRQLRNKLTKMIRTNDLKGLRQWVQRDKVRVAPSVILFAIEMNNLEMLKVLIEAPIEWDHSFEKEQADLDVYLKRATQEHHFEMVQYLNQRKGIRRHK
jgi:hypothetical protein